MVAIIATIIGAFAALLHVYIFVMQSVRWMQPAVYGAFSVPDEAAAETMKPMAYNQGFYNLFLAIGAGLGIVLFWVGADDTVAHVAGTTLVLFSLGSMAAASLVLLSSGAHYLRAALIQGVLPLFGFALFLFS